MIQVIFQMNVLEILLFLTIYSNVVIIYSKTEEKRVDRSSQEKLD